MTTEVLWRAAAFAAAAALGHRGPRAALPVAGFLAGVALCGLGPARFPGTDGFALLSTALALFVALLFWPVWPPVVTDAAETAMLFGLPVLAWTAFVLRGRPAAEVAEAVGIAAAVLAIVCAAGAQASSEASWRRGAMWAIAVLSAAAAGAGLGEATQNVPARLRPLLALGAILLALLAFAPAYFLEGRRVLRELGEESRLGLLPAEDVDVLARPWRRAKEPRFGRKDERKTYVKSALLLAAALQQQRRRSGDAERLRQLEVLTFRTRVRRTLAARAERNVVVDDLTLPA
jgi:hypothetical protein